MEHVAAVRRALGTMRASVDCPCLACAADRLCTTLEKITFALPPPPKERAGT